MAKGIIDLGAAIVDLGNGVLKFFSDITHGILKAFNWVVQNLEHLFFLE